MPVFEYRARRLSGEVVQGTVDAETRQEALAQIHGDGLFPSMLRERPAPRRRAAGGRAPGVASLLRRVPLMTRCAFWRQAASAQNAGFTVHQTIDSLGRSRLGVLSDFCRRKLNASARGTPLSTLMAEAPDLFGPIELGLVRAGEASGRLDTQMLRLAASFEREMEFRNSIRWWLWYIYLLGIVALGSGFVVVVVAPAIQVAKMGGSHGFGAAAARFLAPLLLIGGVALALRIWSVSAASARSFLDRLKLSLPVLGPVFRKLSIARFARALGSLVAGGVPLGESLELAADASGNLHAAGRLRDFVPRVRGGVPLSSVLNDSRLFPAQVVQMVRTGEETGRTDEMLDKVSEYYEGEAAAATMTLAAAAFVAIILMAGVGVALFAFRFYSGGMIEGALSLTEEL